MIKSCIVYFRSATLLFCLILKIFTIVIEVIGTFIWTSYSFTISSIIHICPLKIVILQIRLILIYLAIGVFRLKLVYLVWIWIWLILLVIITTGILVLNYILLQNLIIYIVLDINGVPIVVAINAIAVGEVVIWNDLWVILIILRVTIIILGHIILCVVGIHKGIIYSITIDTDIILRSCSSFYFTLSYISHALQILFHLLTHVLLLIYHLTDLKILAHL